MLLLIQLIKMPAEKHLKYAKISLQRRTKLVSFVEGGMTIVRAALKLGIKSSTAKLIVKRFRTDGTYYESKKSKMERSHQENKEQQSQNVHIDVEPNMRQNLTPLDINTTQWINQPFSSDFCYQINPVPPSYYIWQLNTPTWDFSHHYYTNR